MALFQCFREVLAVEIVDLSVRGDNTLCIHLDITVFFYPEAVFLLLCTLWQ